MSDRRPHDRRDAPVADERPTEDLQSNLHDHDSGSTPPRDSTSERGDLPPDDSRHPADSIRPADTGPEGPSDADITREVIEGHPDFEDMSVAEIQEEYPLYEPSEEAKAQDFASNFDTPHNRDAAKNRSDSHRSSSPQGRSQPTREDTRGRERTAAKERQNDRDHVMRGDGSDRTRNQRQTRSRGRTQPRSLDGSVDGSDLTDQEALSRVINDRTRTKRSTLATPLKDVPVDLRKGSNPMSWEFMNAFEDYIDRQTDRQERRSERDGESQFAQLPDDELRATTDEYRDDPQPAVEYPYGPLNFETMPPGLRCPAARIELQDIVSFYDDSETDDTSLTITDLPDAIQPRVRDLATRVQQSDLRPDKPMLEASIEYLCYGAEDDDGREIPVIDGVNVDQSFVTTAIQSHRISGFEIIDRAIEAVFFSLEEDLPESFRSE